MQVSIIPKPDRSGRASDKTSQGGRGETRVPQLSIPVISSTEEGLAVCKAHQSKSNPSRSGQTDKSTWERHTRGAKQQRLQGGGRGGGSDEQINN